MLEGHGLEQADAEQAYTQALFGAVEGDSGDPSFIATDTWVRLPEELRPNTPKWNAIRDPVCPLRLALYGHPDAGGYWEKHAATRLKRCGFEPTPGQDSIYWHKELQLMLML